MLVYGLISRYLCSILKDNRPCLFTLTTLATTVGVFTVKDKLYGLERNGNARLLLDAVGYLAIGQSLFAASEHELDDFRLFWHYPYFLARVEIAVWGKPSLDTDCAATLF